MEFVHQLFDDIQQYAVGITTRHVHPQDAHFGYYGPPTSSVNWCELDYQFTDYIAEFWNTLSSLAMVVVGLIGMALHYKTFEWRFLVCFATVSVVGIGSMAFHGTLLFGLQMLDELPMIYSALIMAYCVLEQNTPKGQDRYKWLPQYLIFHAIITSILVSSPALWPTYASPLLQFISFHVSFALLEIYLIVRVMKWYYQEKALYATLRPESRQAQQIDQVVTVHRQGLSLWILGIGCWICDYLGCNLFWEGPDSVRMRLFSWVLPLSKIGLKDFTLTIPNPQLHAWWHICASSGLYMLAITVSYKRAVFLGNQASIEYLYGRIPYVAVNQTVYVSKRQPQEIKSDNEQQDLQIRKRKKSRGKAL